MFCTIFINITAKLSTKVFGDWRWCVNVNFSLDLPEQDFQLIHSILPLTEARSAHHFVLCSEIGYVISYNEVIFLMAVLHASKLDIQRIYYEKAWPQKEPKFHPTKLEKKLFIFQIVRFNGICIWQNYSVYCPILEIWGAKTSLFRYLINQKWNNFIKHCPPPIYQQASYIRDAYIYKT